MNIGQAKRIRLSEFLAKLGYEPVRSGSTELWYISPLRNESTPSFKINQLLNAWYDFGEGSGGDIIDFIKRVENLNSTSEALARIASLSGGGLPPVEASPIKSNASTPPIMKLQNVGPVRSRALLDYLRQRGLDSELVRGHVSEAQYSIRDRHYFGLAFASDSGGHEIRNATFKGSMGPKDITTIFGDNKHVTVFEGFFDYLTAIAINGKPLTQTVIILNSASMKSRAVERIRQLSPVSISIYEDNDATGRAIRDYLVESFPDIEVLSHADEYAQFKDLNEWHFSANAAALKLRMSGNGRHTEQSR